MDKLATVATYSFPAEAEAARLLLESQGIRAFLADDNLVGMNWLVSNAVGGVKLQVAETDAKRAVEILECDKTSALPADDCVVEEDIHFACSECGKRISFPAARRGHVEDCPRCGEYVDVPYESELPPPAVAKPQPSTESPSSLSSIVAAPQENRQLWWEVMAVLCLSYFPFFIWGLFGLFWKEQSSYSFASGTLYDVISSIQIIAPLLAIIALGSDRWSSFGIVRIKWISDIAITICVLVCGMFIYGKFYYSIIRLSADVPIATSEMAAPQGVLSSLFCLSGCILSGISQELVMRGYLIARFERLLRSTFAAVLLSTVLFASYHIYQGTAAVVASAAFGLVYAGAFCITRRIWPLCAAHGLNNWIIFLMYY